MEEKKMKELIGKSLKMAEECLKREAKMDYEYGCDGNAFIISRVACLIFAELSKNEK